MNVPQTATHAATIHILYYHDHLQFSINQLSITKLFRDWKSESLQISDQVNDIQKFKRITAIKNLPPKFFNQALPYINI